MQPPKASFWHALEAMPGLAAITSVWQTLMDEDFTPFKRFLEPAPTKSKWFRCPRCSCSHEVFHDDDGTIVAVCRCKHGHCQDLYLTEADITVWELNRGKLSREIARAFGLQTKSAQFGLHETWQIGSWSTDTVPAILTIQWHPQEFRLAVASLAARLKRPFILFAPTSAQTDAQVLEYLAGCGAQLFPLDANLTLTDHGTLHSRTTPGELFAQFTPQPVDDEQMVRNAIALVKAADSGQGARRVSLYTVMRLYCLDCLSAAQIARKCGCARSLVYSRISELRQKLGRDPAALRQYPGHIETTDESLSDPRARRVFRK